MLLAPFGHLMGLFYLKTGDYVLSLVLFTLVTKVLLFPLSLWVQKNSIKMVGIQPEINRIKAKHFGDGEQIAEAQSLLFRSVKYNPFLTLVPVLIQLALLMAVIEVIYHPLTFLLHLDPQILPLLTQETIHLTDVNPDLSSLEISILMAIQNPEYFPSFAQLSLPDGVLNGVLQLDTSLLFFNLAETPGDVLGITLLAPLFAGISAWLLCVAQNHANVLQAEQSSGIKGFGMLFSVVLSLYLGFFVPTGVAFYWIMGNLLAIVQLYGLNAIIPPKNYVDFQDLAESRRELEALTQVGGPSSKWYQKDENRARERKDYKAFFSTINKKVVFYSEKSGYYKYFKSTIETLIAKSNLTIHYVTSDPQDAIFQLAETQPQIKPYYIGEKKLIVLMMKMDADMVLLTLPDLNRFHLKRSYVREDVHYVYLPHDMLSTNMGFSKGALDHYDAIMCAGPHQMKEIRETEALYHLPEKALIPAGYGLIEALISHYEEAPPVTTGAPKILIAPSWQKDNLFDSCLEPLLESLLQGDYHLVLRPHPEYTKRFPTRMQSIVERYPPEIYPNITFELDFSVNHSIFDSALLITDWSAIAFEFSYCTLKPSLFVNTEIKVLNEDYPLYKNLSTEVTLRNKIGIAVEKSQVSQALDLIKPLLEDQDFPQKILKTREENLFPLGKSGEVSAQYVLHYLKTKNSETKK